METIKIDIVNPKAKKIINDLADLDLITIRGQDHFRSFQTLLNNLRTKSKKISLEEIAKEVDLARSKRYAKKG